MGSGADGRRKASTGGMSGNADPSQRPIQSRNSVVVRTSGSNRPDSVTCH